MNFKQISLILTTSLLSSVLSIFVYHHYFATPTKIVTVKESASPKYTSFTTKPNRQSDTYTTTTPTTFIESAEAVTPTVVNIRSIQKGNGSFDDFWGTSGISSGSGVIISEDGYIVTNHHVIEEASDIEVTLFDNRIYEAVIVGTDPSTDLALIKIKESKLPFLPFGNSDLVKRGEWVLAVGNPFNLTSTVTAGIVSAKGRNINILEGSYKIESFIQTDAAVNPGNSGGALVNTQGELVGINTAIITESGRYEGYSFAVPSNLAQKVVTDLKEFGVVQRGFLGVVIRDVDELTAKKMDLEKVEGIYISEINEGSAATDAGLRKGDIIVAINNIPVLSTPALQEQVARYRPGDNIEVGYIRKQKHYTVTMTLKNKSNSTTFTTLKDVKVLDKLGMELRELTAEEEQELEIKGVKVLSVRKGSKIDKANIDPDFIITEVNEKKITDMTSLIKAIQDTPSKIMLKGIYLDSPGEYYFSFIK